HKNGSIIWVSLNVADLKNAEGGVIGTLAAIEDITERKRKEQILVEGEARLADAQKIGQIGNWERSLVTQKLVWSDQQSSLFAYDRNKGLPSLKMFLNSIQPDDRGLVENAIWEQNTEGGGRHFDYRIVLPSGEVRFIQERVAQTLDDSGMVVGLKGTAQDITELKRAEADLRESEARLAEAQQLANVGSWTVFVEDGKQAKSIWSTELSRIFGIPQEDVPQDADAYASMVPEQDRDLVNQAWAKSLDTGVPYELEHCIVRPNGEIRFVRTNARSFKEQAPGVTYWIGATSDITERKIAEEKLQQAQKMEVVGQLTGGVAHDFNNLLTVIVGNLELIYDSVGDDSPLRDMIERSMKTSDRGAALTQRLLSFSRKQTLLPTDLDLSKLVVGLTDMLRSALGDTIEIVIAGEADLWLCAADHSQVESALLNLAINARDAMADGGRLTIETRNISMDDEDVASQDEVDPGDYVCLALRIREAALRAKRSNMSSNRSLPPKASARGLGWA
ncbi:MAG: PAS domain-containing protein, partial [Alphaproteobacteria bacterium]